MFKIQKRIICTDMENEDISWLVLWVIYLSFLKTLLLILRDLADFLLTLKFRPCF